MSDEKTIIADAGNITVYNAPKRRRACLVQYSGAKLGKRFILDEQIMVIGRVPPANIVISEATVSRRHARFIQTEQVIEVEDLGSSNFTFLNDKKVEGRVPLKDGDIVRLGTVLLKFFAHDNIEAIIQDKIYRLATIDAGTQIFNKQYLLDALESEIKFSKTYNKDLSVIMYDLDFFKKVNDTYGHNAGDFILKKSSEVVKTTIRKDDILGRFGGEEFVIILPNTDIKMAYDLAERIRVAVANHSFELEVKGKDGAKQKADHRQTISVGIACLTADIALPEALLDFADKKLYTSKQTGRNKVTM